MEKLKKPKMQHDHTWTDILKVGIFAILMLAPLLAVGSKCLYVACNKNAKESYYGETINDNEYVNITNFNQLEQNKTYLYENENVVFETNLASYIYIMDFDLKTTNFTIDIPSNVIGFRTTYYSGVSYTILRLSDNTDFNGINNSNYTINFTFTYLSNNFSNVTLNSRFGNAIKEKVYNKYSYLDNAFYYAIDELGQEQVFSWTKQTALYSGINEMTQGLGIDPTNNVLALLLTYWMLLTIVYVIVDIVIVLFVKLTHFITA